MKKTEKSAADATQLNRIFLGELSYLPESEKIKVCVQCGTCTASCPVSWAMDYKPREIIALFRAGRLDRLLRSNTPWICASCYYCTVRCPSGIKLSEIMHLLKSVGIRQGLFRRGERFPALAKAFAAVVDRYGRNAESEFLARFYFGTNPLGLLRQLRLGLTLFRRGRLPLLPRRIRGWRDMDKIMAELERGETQ